MSTTLERIRYCATAFAACAIQLAVPFAHGLVTEYQQQAHHAPQQPQRIKAVPVATGASQPRGLVL